MKKHLHRIGAIPPVSWSSESDGVFLELGPSAQTATVETLGELVLQEAAGAEYETAESS